MGCRVKVAVFGVGSLGQWHAAKYDAMEEAELVGVFDVDPARAAEIAAKYNTRAFSDMEALAEVADAASLVVPTHLHYDTFLTLAAHNLHLLVEKPIATTTEEAEEMVAVARQKGLVLQVGHIERFNPVMRFLEDHMRTPTFIEAIRMCAYPPPRPGAAPRGTEVSVVLDMMIHDLELILHLVRSPLAEIRAFGVSVLSPSEDVADVRLRFENGCVANLTANRISTQQMRTITVFQGDSYAALDYGTQTGTLHRKGPDSMQVVDIPTEKGDQLAHELRAFVHSAATRGEPVVTGEQGSQALKLAVDICHIIQTNPS
ncbi:MAG: Gfo/Idh/MocA family oxidoreductase [Lentisphaerae bacterium]|nr:Gfo/Idh/MocA family oxidoreductase [Lentisphaerota bacterium]